MLSWFDGHLDLAYLAEIGRDMHAPIESCLGRLQPAAVTFPSLHEGGVRLALATIFTECLDPEASRDASDEIGPFAYAQGDDEGAHRAGLRQLKLYHAWRDAGVITCLGRRGEASPDLPEETLGVGILMECADPIRTPDELDWWADQGVVAIGMAWWRGSKYASGNGIEPGAQGDGLSDLGTELVQRMDARGVVHDVSHLSERATVDLFEATGAAPIASHSNCRALMGPFSMETQRHLSDDTIREIAHRGGIIGINLVTNFLDPDATKGERASIDHVVAHIEHVCEVVGDRRHVALGSDADGGFSATGLPEGIDRPADFEKIANALRDRGWSDEDVHGFASDNWAWYWTAIED